MPESQSSEEFLKECLQVYPKPAAVLAHKLWNDIVNLNLSLFAFLQLYSSQETVQIFNNSAPQFFGWLQRWLRLAIYLQIARLTDPVRSGRWRRSNASLAEFANRLREAGETLAADELDKNIVALAPTLKKIRKVRDRTLAHSDLLTILRVKPPLPDVTRKELESVVHKIGDAYVNIEHRFRGKRTYFEGADMLTGVEALTAYLERGVQSFEEERRRALDGIRDRGTSPEARLTK